MVTMDDTTPTTPGQTPPVTVPNPHADAPAPSPQDGMRPEAAADPAVRPEQDEPGGPLGGLVGAAATQAAVEASPADADAALLETMGVEGEGIESGQILGLVAATIAAIFALAAGLFFLFYLPFRQQVGDSASNVAQYPELEQVHTEGLAKLGQYARADSLYQVPIGQAMSVVAGRYATAGTAPAGLPSTRQQWNTLSLNRGLGTSAQTINGLQGEATVENQRLAAESEGAVGSRAGVATPIVTPDATTDEEVGVDGAARPAAVSLGASPQTDG